MGDKVKVVVLIVVIFLSLPWMLAGAGWLVRDLP